MNIFRLLPVLGLTILSTYQASAQDMPIGYWRSHLPYNSAVCVASDGYNAFVATKDAFFTYSPSKDEVAAYSKVDGMADVGMSYVGYDVSTRTAILAYANSNIDLFEDGTFYNLPDLKNKSVTGSKAINHIYTEDGFAYLSTDLGIVVINIERREIKETYTFSKNNQVIPVKGLTAAGNYFYAATPKGLYKANRSNINLQDFSVWQPLDTVRSFISIAAATDTVFVTDVDSLYVLENDNLKFIYKSDSTTRHLDKGKGGVWLSRNLRNFRGDVRKITTGNYFMKDSFTTLGPPAEVVELVNGKVWVADESFGFREWGATGPTDYGMARPEGPNAKASYDIYAYNKELMVAHGGYNDSWVFLNDGSGFSTFKDEKWKGYAIYDYAPFGDSVRDFTHIVKGPDGNIYAASNQSGLFVLKQDGSYEYYKQNSVIDEGIGAPGKYRVSGLAFDNGGNLWMTVYGGANELVVKTKENVWYEFSVPYGRPLPNAAANIIIDDNGQKWYVAPRGGGVIVYNDNGTIENPLDDRSMQLVAGKGVGGLPDNEAYCLAKDKSGSIWIGTANGIGVVNCPNGVIARECESELRIVQYDDFAGYLFQNEQVRAIAVDGGNRKWIGTNNGVWLLSPEGDKIISRFTEKNSPLPSNLVQKITIDPITGDVYIGTEKGLVSYRGTATEGGAEHKDVITYPNPVPTGYSGTIAIKGLVENADVRITDIAGQMVYRTTANGGQAVWNGLDYTGRRPQSGVYLIFSTNKDGSQTFAGKMVFME